MRGRVRLAMLAVVGAALRLRPSSRRSSGAPAQRRLLLIRPDHLGDTIMASPIVETLKKAVPGVRITLMVGPWSEEVARRDPLVDEVLVWPFPGFTRAVKASTWEPYRSLREAAALLRGSYDAALVLRFDHWWGAWMCALAGIPLRLGYAVPECRPFLTHLQPAPVGVHWVEQGLREAKQLLALWGISEESIPPSPGLRFRVTEEDRRDLARHWKSASEVRPVVAVHPGAGAAIKLWPEESWTSVGRSLAAAGMQVIVTGSRSESEMAERIAAGIPGARSLAGETPLGTLAALFQRCRLVIGVDNGPFHLAVAVGTETITLFGPSDPAVYGPWGNPARHRVVAADWPGAPCGRLDLVPPDGEPPPCMRSIAPERVLTECRRLGLMVGM